MQKSKITPWYYENKFYETSDKSRVLKIIDHYEIFKKIKNVQGDIYEFGVFKGVSLIRFLTFRDLFENSKKRKIIGFDAFGNFPRAKLSNINKYNDNEFAKNHDAKIGKGIKKEKLINILKKKNFSNFELLKGNIIKTLPIYLQKNPNIKIALLHIDLDTYESTDFVLNILYKNVVKKGLLLIDDYKHIKGATMAVNKFLKLNNLEIHKVSQHGRPYYIIKK